MHGKDCSIQGVSGRIERAEGCSYLVLVDSGLGNVKLVLPGRVTPLLMEISQMPNFLCYVCSKGAEACRICKVDAGGSQIRQRKLANFDLLWQASLPESSPVMEL